MHILFFLYFSRGNSRW